MSDEPSYTNMIKLELQVYDLNAQVAQLTAERDAFIRLNKQSDNHLADLHAALDAERARVRELEEVNQHLRDSEEYVQGEYKAALDQVAQLTAERDKYYQQAISYEHELYGDPGHGLGVVHHLKELRGQLEAAQQWRDVHKEIADNQAWHVRDLRKQVAQLTAERDIAERALTRGGYRKTCDIAACNCGSQWEHGGHASERLREIADALPYQNGGTLLGCVEGLVTDLTTLRGLVEALDKALIDWMRCHAPEEFTAEQLAETRARLQSGVLAYIAYLRHDIKIATLAQAQPKGEP